MHYVSAFRASVCACAALGGGGVPAHAQSEVKPVRAVREDKLDLSGSVRLRYETLEGQSRVGLAPEDALISVRTTLRGEYRAGDVRIGAELYDSRAYLGKPGSAIGTGEVNALELVQIYAGSSFDDVLGRGSAASVQFGRFTLNLGSRRLVAADDYRNTTNGYTGLRADLRGANDISATLIYTLPQMRRPDDQPAILDNKVAVDRESFDLQLWGGVVSKPKLFAGALAELSYFGLAERDSPDRPSRDRQLHTTGARLIREPASGSADFEVEGFYQFGTISTSAAATATRLDVAAWFLHADVGYSFPGPLKVRLSVEYDYASGDRPGGRFGRFDTLFGMRRADLGPAGIYAQIGRANISTPGLRLEVAPTPRLDAFTAYRAMWLADATDAFSTTGVRDPDGRSGRFAGHQLEGRLRWWLVPQFLRAEFNAAWIGKGRFLKTAPNAPPTGNTRYLSIALTSTF